MAIPERRYVDTDHHYCSTYQCLSCYVRWGSDTSAAEMSYCPFCGIRWVGDCARHRPNSIPRWQWDLFDKEIEESRKPGPAGERDEARFDAAFDRKMRLEEHLRTRQQEADEMRELLREQRQRREEYARLRRRAAEYHVDYFPTPERDTAGVKWQNVTEESPQLSACAAVRFSDGRQRVAFCGFNRRWSEMGTGYAFPEPPVLWYGQDPDRQDTRSED